MIVKKILLAIPLLMATWFITNCWIEIATTSSLARWQHYMALVFLAVPIYFFFKDFTKAVITTGIFLLLGTCKAFSMTVDIETCRFGIGPLETPPFNWLAFELFVVFGVLNLSTMINLHLDYKEMKNKKNS